MEYRIHKKTGNKISILGLGTSYIADTPEKEITPMAAPASVWPCTAGVRRRASASP